MNRMDNGKLDQTRKSEGGPKIKLNDLGPNSRGSDVFFAAIEMTRMPMVLTNPREPDNPIVFANDAFVDLTGYPLEEIIGRNCRFLQGVRTDPSHVAEVREAIRESKTVNVEILNYRKDGSTFWNGLFINPVHAEDGELLYFFASQLDVSRRRNAEDALKQTQKMEALGQLTGGLAHDFNNHLQVMIGWLDRLGPKLASHPDQSVARAVTQINSAAERAATLTQQLLSFARKQRLQQRAVNLNELLSSIMDFSLRTILTAHSYAIELDPNLSNAIVDPTQTESAMVNILINARDAMPDGGCVTIKTSHWSRERIAKLSPPPEGLDDTDYVCISVSDTGTGISPDVLNRVTEPFFTTKEQGKGSGLGLSMVYGYMRQTGGGMHIETDVGRGTTVHLFFKATDRAARDADIAAIGVDKPGRETILVVEDQSDVLMLATAILEDTGYKVLTATNADRAIEAAMEHPEIALVFSDIMMPGSMNGVTLANELTKLRVGIRILLTTGYPGDALREKTSEQRWPILQKPWKAKGLTEAIRKLLDA